MADMRDLTSAENATDSCHVNVSGSIACMARKARWLTKREMAAWGGFMTMRFKLLSHLARELQRQTGLSEADYDVLVVLSEAPEQRLRLGELGERLGWEKSRLSKQFSRMSTRGLVTREDCLTDSRGAFAVLTKSGRRAIEAAAPIHVELVRKWFIDALTPAELEAMTAIGTAVVDRLTRHQADESSGKQTNAS
jgi:DNA-binding MarR family transcriptional regulator